MKFSLCLTQPDGQELRIEDELLGAGLDLFQQRDIINLIVQRCSDELFAHEMPPSLLD